MSKFSIIMPCYNSEKSIDRSLVSLKKQAFKGFELIVIDDCSTDGTFNKLNQFKTENPSMNIMILQNEVNSGPSKSRNKGMEIAQGEYIIFLDSDDWFSETALERIATRTSNNPDCVIFDAKLADGEKTEKYLKMFFTNKKIETLERFFVYTRGSTCGKAYKREIVQGKVVFPDYRLGEDIVFTKCALYLCKSFEYINEPLYFYLYYNNPQSLVHVKRDNIDRKQRFSLLKEKFNLVKEYCDKLSKAEMDAYYVLLVIYPICLVSGEKGVSIKEIRKTVKELERERPNCYKNHYIKDYMLKYRVVILLGRLRLFRLIRMIARQKRK